MSCCETLAAPPEVKITTEVNGLLAYIMNNSRRVGAVQVFIDSIKKGDAVKYK